MLIVFGGLPATGKSTISLGVAKALAAVHLRIDTIEQELRNSGIHDIGPAGYTVAYQIASDNLNLGLTVVSDSVNPIAQTREAWRDVGIKSGVRVVEIEIVCSDQTEHKKRSEQRMSEIDGLVPPDWNEIQNREYHDWPGQHILIDTSNETPVLSIEKTLTAIKKYVNS